MIKSQHTTDRSQSRGSGNDGAGGKKYDTESDDGGHGDVEYVGWSVGGGKMIPAGKSSTTECKPKQAVLYGVSSTEETSNSVNLECTELDQKSEVLEEKKQEATMTEADIQVLLAGTGVTSTKQNECTMTEDKVEVLSVGCSVGSTEPASTEEVPGSSFAEVKDTRSQREV